MALNSEFKTAVLLAARFLGAVSAPSTNCCSILTRLILAAALTFAAAAHAGWRDDAPAIKDPFEGLLPVGALKPGDKGPIANAKSKRLALVLSENANAHLKWSDEAAGIGVQPADRFFGSMFVSGDRMAEIDKTIAETYRAQLVTAAVLKPLADAFKEVKLMNDFAEFRDSGFDLALLVDVSFINTFNDGFIIGSHYESGTTLKAYFITSAFTAGPAIEISQKREADRNKFHPVVAAVRAAVLTDYDAKMRVLVGATALKSDPGRGASAPAPVSTPSAVPVAERLRQLDQLLRDGLITDTEAAQKRKQILDGM